MVIALDEAEAEIANWRAGFYKIAFSPVEVVTKLGKPKCPEVKASPNYILARLRPSKSPLLLTGATLLDFLRLFLIQLHHFVASLAMSTQKLIKLTLDGLRVSVFGPLDEQGHEQSRERST